VLTACWQALTLSRIHGEGVPGDDLHPGAVGGDVPVASLLPPPATVTEDWVRLEEWDCRPLASFPTPVCRQPVDAEQPRRVVMVGDSHVQQLAGALAPIAAGQGWELTVAVFGACPYSTTSEVDLGAGFQDCVDWGAAVTEEIVALDPDVVVTLASRDVRPGPTEVTPDGFVARWAELDELGIPVLAVRDNPRFDHSPPDCLVQLGRGAAECGAVREDVYAPDPPYLLRDDVPPNVAFLDLADLLYDATLCPAELGNVLVYMDDNHLTASFTTTLAPLVEEHVRAAMR
jgi:hypothetical protein